MLFPSFPEFSVSEFNIAAKSKDEQDKVAVDLVASAVAYKRTYEYARCA